MGNFRLQHRDYPAWETVVARVQHRQRGQQQDELAAEPALSNHFLLKRREVGTPLRTAIGFADVHAGHGDAGRQKPFQHPVFTRFWKGW